MADFGRCRSCNRKIVWIKTQDGKRIPLDAVAPVWQVYDDGHPAVRMTTCYVSHFNTCPDADLWSKSKKEETHVG